MKRILLLLFLISGLGLSASAQRSVLRGTIVDSVSNTPLPGVVVLVDSTLYDVAGEQGTFSVSNVPRKEVEIEISFLGYETILMRRNIDQGTVDLGTIRMKESGTLMESVTITAVSTSAIIKGDTTQYNAAAYKTNPDADAGDLLGKLPGVTVEDGAITFQGETVARAYVDGKGAYYTVGEGGVVPHPRWSSVVGADAAGTRYLFDGSYLRLKNAELAYTFTGNWVKRAGMRSLKLYLNGDNLLLWTDMPDDRESNFSGGSGNGAYPTMRRFNFGINIIL